MSPRATWSSGTFTATARIHRTAAPRSGRSWPLISATRATRITKNADPYRVSELTAEASARWRRCRPPRTEPAFGSRTPVRSYVHRPAVQACSLLRQRAAIRVPPTDCVASNGQHTDRFAQRSSVGEGPRVECDTNCDDLAVFHPGPIRRGNRVGYGRMEVVPGQDVGSIDEDLVDLDVGDDLSQAFQPVHARIDSLDLCHWTAERDVVGEEVAKSAELLAFPRREVGVGNCSEVGRGVPSHRSGCAIPQVPQKVWKPALNSWGAGAANSDHSSRRTQGWVTTSSSASNGPRSPAVAARRALST